MALATRNNGNAHVLEISNRAIVQKLSAQDVDAVIATLDNHMSGLNTNAHGIPNIAGLQTALDGKVDDGQVLTNVPVGAVFTDTVYSKPTSEPISYISGLQTALDGKQDTFTGYTGSITVVTGVDFVGETVTTGTINVSNGIITSIS